jgi:AraC family transcriptional regulator, transcriptional activator of pobA
MTKKAIGRDQYRGEYLKPALFKREIKPARFPYLDFYHVFLLSGGKAEVAFHGERHNMEEQSAFAFPPSCNATLTLHAGTEAYLVGVTPELLIDIIGNKAESVLIRIFTERPALIDGTTTVAEPQTDVASLAKGFLREASLPGLGSEMAVAAYMRLIIMAIWRAGDWDTGDVVSRGHDIDILQRFRRLVELHFRERKTIAFYAQELGLTHDRLHAICTRALGRTPKSLIQQRILQEANLRLERSGRSVQEIAHQLGFTDQTYFSHFYKHATGISPNTFRRSVSPSTNFLNDAEFAKFAEWP